MSVQELYIFNPENDLAIANGNVYYMAPPGARAIARDLSLLPLWYAGPCDDILLPDAVSRREGEVWASRYGFTPRFLLPEELTRYAPCITGFTPWGWSPEMVRRLCRVGIGADRLPSAEQVSRIRELSHRAITVTLLSSLPRYGYADIPDSLPVQLSTPEDVCRFLESAPNTVLKAPWSGSGKGIAWGRGIYDTTLERWSNGILRRQGTVIGEPFWDKVTDLAMEFFSDGVGHISFSGYSLFDTNTKGVYKSNWLASNEMILAAIERLGIDVQQLQQLQDAYRQLLAPVVGTVYRGHFGIDMMIYRSGDTVRLHPCIELNLRMNMGMVARHFYDRYVDSRATGRYYVDYYPDARQLYEDHCRRSSAYPLQTSAGRFCRGYLSLTPVTSATRYRARVEISIPE